MVLTSFWWRFLENNVYSAPDPPPKVRTKPMEVIAVGPPRSATESLQAGLLRLGYEHTYHGWDILYEDPNRSQAWTRLARRKFFNDPAGAGPITADDFDALLGDSVAVTDAAASVFAAEMIRAYPEAKVVINTRRDMGAWMESMNDSVLDVYRNRLLLFLSWFDGRMFWTWHLWERFLWPGLFRCIDSREGLADAVVARGTWVYEEHCNMVRGLVPPERRLDWSAQDGWEPLCAFLGKPVPDEAFPHVNIKSKHWKENEAKWGAMLVKPALRNLGILVAVLVAGGAAVGYKWMGGW